MTKRKPKRVKMICGHCGGENVQADAYAHWNVETQQWELTNTFDKGAICDDCDGETRIKEVIIPEEPRPEVPKDFPVQPLKPGEPAKDRMTCGECGRSWDDAQSTEWTPVPAGRCPFEYFH